MADLDSAFAGALIRRAHQLRVFHRKRHRLFLIYMLACVEGRDKAPGMQVVRRRNDDSVDRFVIEQRPELGISAGVWSQCLCVFKTAGVDIGKGRQFDAGTGRRFARKLRTALTNANYANPNPVIRAEGTSGREAADPGGHVTDEVSPGPV